MTFILFKNRVTFYKNNRNGVSVKHKILINETIVRMRSI